MNKCKEHQEICKQVLEHMPSDEVVYELANLFKIFGDDTRIKILFSMLKGELCVSDIVEVVNMNQSAVSHQLIILRKNRLVKTRKVGKEVYYSLDDEHILQIFNVGLDHVEEL